LYKLIDNFDGLLLYADNKKRQKIQLYLKQKYQYIDAIQNYNLWKNDEELDSSSF